MNADWTLKLIALLHDPPDKVLALQSHQRRAFEWIERLIGQDDFRRFFNTTGTQLTRAQFEAAPVGQAVKKADQVASAMDRAAFPRDINLSTQDFVQSPCICHPLGGRQQPLDRVRQADFKTVINALNDVFTEALNSTNTVKQRVLWLWRKMAEALAHNNVTNGLAMDWHIVSADTRIVDHTLWDHLSVTAALAVALPRAALMVCSVGPVQEFIRTARRTQDLWMGSYILSYLAWRGMQVIAEEFGPDVILYPSLRGQPLVDHWLATQHRLSLSPRLGDLARATLPNKFVALLPDGEAKRVAEQVCSEVQRAWGELADAVTDWLKSRAKVVVDSVWRAIFHAHKQQMPEIYWIAHRWPDVSSFAQSKDEADVALDEVRRLLRPPPQWEFQHIYNVFCATAPRMVNIGTIYSRLHDLAQRGFEARKGLRDFAPIEELGEKCTLCGMRSALHTQNQSARDHWKRVAEQVRRVPGEFVTIKPGGRERLCGVCIVKRLVQRGFFERELDLRGGFPSTSEVAVASFKEGVLSKLSDPQHRQRLVQALHDHLQALRRLGVEQTVAEGALPKLRRRLNQLSPQAKADSEEFLKYDGDVFFEETFTHERLKADYDLDASESDVASAQDSLRRLLKAAEEAGIPRPSNYFAIIMLDGDEMGKWLGGEKAPLFEQALHQEVARDLRARHPAWNTVLDSKRMLSPALHAAISTALANFALYFVPLVIEQRYCGRVVYAGGDDVLALMPVDQVLPAARELRALFSGEAGIDAGLDLRVCFRNAAVSGFVMFNNKPLMTMGPNATASVGIAVSHHLSPLDRALAAARRAEESAKKDYGRNALCVHFLKRSGEEMRVGAQWFYAGTDPQQLHDTVELLSDVQQRFADMRISMKFAHAVFDEARMLAAVRGAYKAEMCRLLKRHRGSALTPQQGKQQADELAPQLAQLAHALNIHCPNADPAPNQPQLGLVELAKWLLLLRFLAQGGGRD
ncbi:MAG TPA: type III-B CRISPR-associated protein Cas10/Cmr2 [Alphaproteobacteria bacterium]|nr:type III-B CRISPR-associated protein Cas10/Cmr2 [Alphaproteobacteria bacterium]